MNRLFKNLEKFKKRVALVNLNNNIFTYGDILKISSKISNKVDKDSTILIIVSNNVESIIGYVSFVRSQNLSIILDKTFKVDYAKKIVKKYRPNYIFTPKNFFKKSFLKKEIYSGKDYVLYKTSHKLNKNLNKENLLMLSTSGTTQSPKFVRLSNSNITHNTQTIANYLNINSNHTTITTMPMGYSYGLSIINTHLHKGSRIIVNDKSILDKTFWKAVYKYKVTSFGGVPSFYEILRKINIENFNLSSLKCLTQAGGKLELETLKYFEKLCRSKNIKFFAMYGQTEASPRMSYLEPNKLAENFGSIGKPLNQSFFKIISEKKKVINKYNVVGELVYYGKNVCLGYASSYKDLKKGDVNKGILFTGDLAIKNKKGYYYIKGRKNRFSKIFGIRLNLDDIENYFKKNKYEIKCLLDDKNLRINIKNNYNLDEIKNIVFKNYGINPNNIIINKVKSFMNENKNKNQF